MDEQKFLHEMHRSETLRKFCNNPMESEYWAGYMRGVRRAYHGESFGTADEHNLWLSLINKNDDQSKNRGRGYIDGFNCENKNKGGK